MYYIHWNLQFTDSKMGADLYSTGIMLSGMPLIENTEPKPNNNTQMAAASESGASPAASVADSSDSSSSQHTLDQLKEIGAKTPILATEIGTDFNYKREIVWFNTIGFVLLHLAALIGLYLMASGHAKVLTSAYCMSYIWLSVYLC